jgi:hypothetical protein
MEGRQRCSCSFEYCALHAEIGKPRLGGIWKKHVAHASTYFACIGLVYITKVVGFWPQQGI